MTPGCILARLPVAVPRRGFTIIELMLTVMVLGVLLAVAYPNFVDQIRKSRRADAVAALTAVQQAQERWRSNHASYANFNTAAGGASANGLSVASHSASNHYTLAIDGFTATGYTVVATAAEGSSQQADVNCKLMGLRADGGNLKYGSGGTSIDWTAANPDAGNCWAR